MTSYRICIVQALFNELITSELVKGAQAELSTLGIPGANIVHLQVPGSFEIPAVVSKALKSKSFDAVIAVGCIIRGETSHFDHIAGPCASALMSLSTEFATPVIFCVLTTDTIEQAMNRAGLKLGHKGREAAVSAIKTIQAMRSIASRGENDR